jgi:hypothetical protein
LKTSTEDRGRELAAKLLEDPTYTPQLGERLERLREQAAALRRAIAMGEQECDAVRGRLSREICAGLLPMHRRWCRETLNALLDCAAANKKQEALRYQLDLAGYGSVPFPQFQYPQPDPGQPDDPTSVLRMWLTEAYQNNLINRAEFTAIVEGLKTSVVVEAE